MRLDAKGAFGLSFALGFVAGFVFVGVSFGWLTFFVPASVILEADLAVGIVVGFLFGLSGLAVFYLGKVVGRAGLISIGAVILTIGVITVQPELDFFAVLPLIFAFIGGNKGR